MPRKIIGVKLIPFIRTLPNGETRLEEIDRGPVLYEHACKFIAHGGRFLIRINETLHVDMVAITCRDGDSSDAKCVASEECENGPEMLDHIDRLVKKAAFLVDVTQ